ncbi:MAG: SAM-dependent methyltransferase, partial [Bacteroidota bacterium]
QVPFFYPLPDETYEDKSITDPKEREKAFGQDDHVRLYGSDYGKRLASSGFKVKEENFIDGLKKEEVVKYALPQSEIIYKVIK